MKKLLAGLGSISLVASSSAMAVSCGSVDVDYSRNFTDQNALKFLAGEFGRAAVVAQETKTDLSYIIEHKVMGEKIKDANPTFVPNKEEHILSNDYAKVSELFNNYFGKSLLSTDFKTNLIADKTPAKPDNSMQAIADLLPMLMDAMKKMGPAGMIGFLANSKVLQTLIDPMLLNTVGSLFGPEVLTALANGFNKANYVGMTNQQVMQSAGIGLINAISGITGTPKDKFIDGLDKTNIDKNYASMNAILIEQLGKIIKDGISIGLGTLVSNMGVLTELLRSVFLILSQVSHFSAEPETENIAQKVIDFGKEKFNSFDEINLSNIIKMIGTIKGFENFVTVLLPLDLNVESKKVNTGGLYQLLIPTISIFVKNFLATTELDQSLEMGGQKIEIHLHDGQLMLKVMGVDAKIGDTSKLDVQDLLNNLLNSLAVHDKEKFWTACRNAINGMGGIGAIVMIKVKKLFPDGILGAIYPMIENIIKPILPNIEETDLNIDLDNLYGLFNALKTTLGDAVKDFDHLFDHLGLIKDKDGKFSFKKDSALEFLMKIVGDLDIEKLIPVILGLLNSADPVAYNEFITKVNDSWSKVKKATVTGQDNNYTVKVGDKTILVKLQQNNRNFVLKSIQVN